MASKALGYFTTYLGDKIKDSLGINVAEWELAIVLYSLDPKKKDSPLDERERTASLCSKLSPYIWSNLGQTVQNRILDQLKARYENGELDPEILVIIGQVVGKTAIAGWKLKDGLVEGARSVFSSMRTFGQRTMTTAREAYEGTKAVASSALDAGQELQLDLSLATTGATTTNSFGHKFSNVPAEKQRYIIKNAATGGPKLRKVRSKVPELKVTQIAAMEADEPHYGLYKGQFHLPLQDYYRYLGNIVPRTEATGGKRKTKRHAKRRHRKTRRHL